MKIAVTYEDEKIFQHFGKTEQFKVYDVEDGKIQGSKVIGTDGRGHSALADVLEELGADLLICGGIGAGAQEALAEAGIVVYAGNFGGCDDAIQNYLNGSILISKNATCDHHHAEGEHDCGGHCQH